jgi:transcriptional regulator with XRE-family HTH domain
MGEKNEHGIAEVFRKGLRAYRERRGLRQQDLIDLLARDHGVKMDRATLTRMESGDRRVTLEEAVLLAVALDVPLPLLLLPIDDETDVALTPTVRVYPWLAWEWMRGREPLPTSTLRDWHPVVQPLWLYDGVREAQKTAQKADHKLRHAEYVGDEEPTKAARESYADALSQLASALTTMRQAGLPVEGLLPDKFRADMDKLGLLKGED